MPKPIPTYEHHQTHQNSNLFPRKKRDSERERETGREGDLRKFHIEEQRLLSVGNLDAVPLVSIGDGHGAQLLGDLHHLQPLPPKP